MPFVDLKKEKIEAPVECDVCIIGAGAAGITLANHLAGSSQKILLLESGDFSLENETQSLYTGANLGLPYYGLASCRLRYFGGTTNHWAGYCGPNEPEDYRGRPELGIPEWPVKENEIKPYIDTAAQQLGLAPEGFNPLYHGNKFGFSEDDLLDDKLSGVVTKVYQLTKRLRFREIYRDKLEALPNLTVFLNCNVTQLNVEPNGKAVGEAAFVVLSGSRGTIRAKYFILACHAIENARILLNSNDVMPRGIGNQYDQVGRYFMEHPAINSGLFIANPARFNSFYDARRMLPEHLNANLGLTAEVSKKAGILQYWCRFQRLYSERQVKVAMGRLQRDFWDPFEMDMLDDIDTILSDLGEATALVEEKVRGKRSAPMRFYLDHRIEQAPNPDSRVVLSDESDSLGLRKANLIWRLNENDYRCFQKGQEIIVKELSAAGIGRFIVEDLTEERINRNVTGRNHHMGTTRMASDEKEGVVDSNCQVYGINNLYVAGSSVFTTAGYGAPTMLIIAFALRLAEHLNGRLRS